MAVVDIPIRYVKDDKALRDTIAEWKKLQKEVGLTDNEIDKAKRSTKELSQETNNLSKGFDNVGTLAKGMAALFAADQVFQFTKQIIAVRGEFQKFEAVLTNTLGSRGLAREALDNISKWAARTPYQVDQVTESFVKLANQGFVPTMDELTSLGDLAASTGKEFDQLTEAIIDAQVGEFERLKEFGIRAAKEGNNVTFTFKGVQTQVEFTETAIRNYILSLGEAEGVSGSMAAISETLEGKVSNLEDAWTNFMNKLGILIQGPGGDTINFLSDAINLAGQFIDVINRVESEAQVLTTSLSSSAGEQLNNIDDLVQRLNEVRRNMEGPMFPFERRTAEAEEQKLLDMLKQQSEELAKQYTLDQDRKKIAEEAKKLSQEQLDLITQYREMVDDTRNYDTALSVAEVKKLEKAVENVTMEAIRLKNTLEKLEADPSDKLKRQLKDIEEEIRTLGLGAPELGGVADAFADAEEMRTRKQAEEAEKRKEIAEKEKEERLKIEEAAYYAFADIMDAALAVSQARTDREIENLEKQEEYKLSLAGNNEKQRQSIMAETDQRKKDIQSRDARRTQQIASYEAYVHTLSAAVEALPNYVLAAFITATGIAQQVAINSRQPPRYKHGVKGVPGIDTGQDTVHAILRPREYVFPVETVDQYKPALDAIFDKRISPDIMNAIASGKATGTGGSNISPKDLEMAISRAMAKIPFHNISIDKQGFHDYVKSVGSEVYKDINEFSM